MNTITNLNTFPLGNSLDGVNIITEEINTLSLLVDGTNSMVADLNLDNHKIKNLEEGVDAHDAINKSQLDTKANTTYVNTQLGLKADTSYVNTQLGLKADTSYVNTQLGLKADTSYVNTQLGLKADKTYVDTNLALKADKTYVDTNLALKADKTYVDASFVNLLTTQTIGGTKTFTNQVTFNGTTKTNLTANDIPNAGSRQWLLTSAQTFAGTKTFQNGANLNAQKITNMANGTANSDAVNFLQLTDVSNAFALKINNLESYVNTKDTSIITSVDSSLNILKNYVNSQDTSIIASVDSSLNILKTYVDASLNLKVNKAGDTMTDTLTINKNATSQSELTTSSSGFNLISGGQTVYDRFNFTGTTAIYIYLVNKTSSDTTLVNRDIYFNFTSPTTLYLVPYGGVGVYFNLNGVDKSSSVPVLFTSSFKLACSSTIGYYTTGVYETFSNTDQLTIRSSLNSNTNTEFTGIRFLNTNTDAGFIRVETDRPHSNATMRFQVRQNNGIVTPLTMTSSLNAINPYLVNGANICSIGYNQTWQTLTGSRAKDANNPTSETNWYQNTTGRPISVNANFTGNNDANISTFGLEVSTTNSSSGIFADRDFTANDSNEFTLRGIIPSTGQTWYRVVKISGNNTTWGINYWSELR